MTKHKQAYPALLQTFGVRENQASGPRVLNALYKIMQNDDHRAEAPQVASQFLEWAQFHHKHFNANEMKRIRAITTNTFESDAAFEDIRHSLSSIGLKLNRLYKDQQSDELACEKYDILSGLLEKINTEAQNYSMQAVRSVEKSNHSQVALINKIQDLVHLTNKESGKALASHRYTHFGLFTVSKFFPTESEVMLQSLGGALNKTQMILQPEAQIENTSQKKR